MVTGRRRAWGGPPWRAVWRQSQVDASPLGVEFVVVALAAFIAAVVPQVITAVETSELRAAVSAPDANTDMVVTVPFEDARGGMNEVAPATADTADWIRGIVDSAMPPDLRSVLTPPVTALTGPELKAGVIADRPGRARFIYVASDAGPAVEWVSGRQPQATGEPSDQRDAPNGLLPIEVAVSEATADTMGIRAGDSIEMVSDLELPLDVRVSGIFRPIDSSDIAWHVAPRLLEPQLVDGSAAVAVVGLMVSDTSVPFALVATFPRGMTRTFTYTVVPSALDATNAAAVEVEARGLASGKQVFATLGPKVRVTTQFDGVLRDTSTRIDAAAAQASVLLIGVLSATVAVILVASRLVVERRSLALAQWRARGGTLAALGFATAAEAFLVVGAAGLVGARAASLVGHGGTPWAWLIPPLAISALTPPTIAVWVGLHRGGRRRSPRRRGAAVSASTVRRIAGEALLLLAALGSVTMLRVRGVGASAGSVWSDIAVLAAPVLAALSVVVVALRAQPTVIDVARSTATRVRGAVSLLAVVRARMSGMSASALVLATSVAAMSASLAVTVGDARTEASWDVVGADVAVTTDDQRGLPDSIGTLVDESDVAVAEASRIGAVQVIGPGVDDRADVIIVDPRTMSRVLAADSTTAWDDAEATLQTARVEGQVPALIAGAMPDWEGASLRWDGESVPVVPVGIAPSLPPQFASDTWVVVVDRAVFEAAIGRAIPATVAWASGPGAEGAVTTAIADAHAEETSHVVTREGWLAERRASPLAHALDALFVMAAAVSLAMSMLVVILMASAGSPERLRAIARARVVGLPRRAAHRVAWLEVAIPVVAWGLVGVVVGLGLVHVLVAPLDLQSLTGGTGDPRTLAAWWCLAVPVALGVVAWASVTFASRARGGERLASLMRVN